MILTVLLILCAVNIHCAQEGDSCTKDGVPGVCTDLKLCPDALQDIQNKKRPQHCVYGTQNAIVCCVSPVTTTTTIERPQKCVLPPYPEHGSYTANVAGASPGEVHDFFVLNVTCEPGYSMDGPKLLFCRDGWWPEKMSNCISQSCTKGDIAGVCTKLNQCPAAREDIKNRIAPQHCWFGSVDPIVCCVPRLSAGTATPITSTTTKRTKVSSPEVTLLSNNIDKGEEEKCDPLPEFLSPKPTGQKAWDKCLEYQDKLIFPCSRSKTQGYSRSNRCHHHADVLVTGPGTAEPYEFPHAGLLGFERESESLRWLCVGSLISEKFVLTAAHCTKFTYEGEVKYVQLGVLRRSALPEKDRYRVRRIINHPEYSPPAKYNDIALLELEQPVALDEFIVPACLVTGTPVDDSLAVFTGWGSTAFDEKPSEYLKKLVVSKFESQECAASYEPSRLIKNGIDERTQVCYGDKSTFISICRGDSGGPLQIKNKQISCMYSVIGVASIGVTCGRNSSSYDPDVYTMVAPYVDWIEATVWPATPACVP